jgi:dolichol-phosphate mannosyltransferase
MQPSSADSEAALIAAPTGPLLVPAKSDESSEVRLSLVIPTYEESENLLPLLAQLTTILDARLPGRYELIVVDDDSRDRTWQLAQSACSQFRSLRVMRRVGERGLSSAVVRGWQVARGDVLAAIDADLQHPPEVVAKLYELIRRGADLAVASRNAPGGGVSTWSFRRRLISRGAQLLGLCVLPGVVGRVSDPLSGYFMLRRETIADIVLRPLGYKILLELLARGRIEKIAEQGYVFRERGEGSSKVSTKLYVEYVLHLLRMRFT